MSNAYWGQKAGHVLDAHVQVNIFDKEVVWGPSGTSLTAYCKGESDYGFGVVVPAYSQDMKEAWKVVDHMKELPGAKWDRFIKLLVDDAQFEDGRLHMVGEKIPEATFSDIIRNLTPVKICRAALETIRTFKVEAAGLAEGA